MEYWKTDEWGRRYRIVDGIKEYEMEVTTTNGTYPQGFLPEMKKGQIQMGESEIQKTCPFKNGISRKCDKTCAFYSDDGCMKNRGETAGKKCPLNRYNCDRNCVFYDAGCKLIRSIGEVLK